MKEVIERIFCDFCKAEFDLKSTYWNDSPATLKIEFGRPAQDYESYEFEHICLNCRNNFHDVMKKLSGDIK